MPSPFSDKQYSGPPESVTPELGTTYGQTPWAVISRTWGARLWLSIAAKAPLVQEWINDDRYYLGKHWAQRRVSTWRPDPVSNIIYTVIDEHASQLASSDYDAIFLPRKPSDMEAAEMYSDLWSWWYERHNIRYWMDDVAVGSILKGTMVVKVVWDQSVKAGTNQPEEVPAELRVKRRKGKKTAESEDENNLAISVPSAMDGDAIALVIDPANFHLDPGAYDLQSAAWCGTLQPMLVTEAKNRWPKWAHRFVPEYTFNLSEIYWRPATFQAFQASAGAAGAAYLNVFEGWEKSARVCDCGAEKLPEKLENGQPNPYYHPPGHKEGLVRCVMVGATSGEPIIVERQPHFYRHGRYPFGVFRDIPVAKSFWGQGEAAQLRSLQDLRNRLIEQVAINALLTANTQYTLAPGSGINPTAITSEPGKIYPSKVPDPLRPIKREPIPQYVFEILHLTENDMQKMAGMFSAPPPGIRAGYAIIALLERMAARIKRKGMRFEMGIKEIVELVIEYYKEFSTEARLLRITDSAGQVKWNPFQGSDYAQAEVDVKLNIAPHKPFSRAVLQEYAAPLLGRAQPDGTPVVLASEYLEVIGWPDTGTIERNRQKEQEAAQRQQQQASGEPEGASTLLGEDNQPAQGPPQTQGGGRVSPQTQQPGAGQGNGRGVNSRLTEGLTKAGGG